MLLTYDTGGCFGKMDGTAGLIYHRGYSVLVSDGCPCAIGAGGCFGDCTHPLFAKPTRRRGQGSYRTGEASVLRNDVVGFARVYLASRNDNSVSGIDIS